MNRIDRINEQVSLVAPTREMVRSEDSTHPTLLWNE